MLSQWVKVKMMMKHPPSHSLGGGGPFCSEPTPVSTKLFWYTVSILQNGLSITHGSTKMVVPVTCFDPQIC